MAETVANIISARSREPEGLAKMIVWSAAAHVVVIVGLLVMPTPHVQDEPRVVMQISLGGAIGPQTGGQTQIGGRQIDAPPPAPEPEAPPIPARQVQAPPTPAQPQMTLPPPPTAPRRAPEPQPQAPPRRPQQQPQPQRPQTQAQAQPQPRRNPFSTETPQRGSTTVETGARGVGAGLSSGGGGGTGGVQLDVDNFCCPQYISQMIERIQRNWDNNQGAVGTTTMRFTIYRDGRIDGIQVARPSSHWALNFAAERALLLTNDRNRLPPLPQEFPNQTLTVHLTFIYEP